MKIKGHEIKLIGKDYIYLECSGKGKSITNDVENIVTELSDFTKNGYKIYYKDSTSRIDQIVTKNGNFFYFKSGLSDPVTAEIKQKLGYKKQYPWE